MKTVLYISPSPSVKGGISSVIKSYLNTNLAKKHRIFQVSSHCDGPKFLKLMVAILGLFKTFCYLISKKIDGFTAKKNRRPNVTLFCPACLP